MAFDHDFGVRTSDPALVRYVDRVFGALVRPGEPAHWYSMVDHGPGTDGRYSVTFDSDEQLRTSSPLSTFSFLLWDVNRRAIASCSDRVVVHAAAADHQGVAALLPAPMDAGKTTLVAGLVRAGLRYLTDEAVAIDPRSRRLTGLAKPLTINAGSWDALSDLEPALDPDMQQYVDGQWHVDVRSIRPDAVVEDATAGYVIVPRYVYGAHTELTALPRPRALLALCQNSFNLAGVGRPGLAALAEVVRGSSCYELTIGDLGSACRLVLDLVSTTERRPKPPSIRLTGPYDTGRSTRVAGVDRHDVPVPAASVVGVEIEGESVLLDPTTGTVHHLDAAGTLTWGCFNGSSTVSELAAQLSDAFGEDIEDVLRDLSAFADSLVTSGLLTLRSSGQPAAD